MSDNTSLQNSSSKNQNEDLPLLYSKRVIAVFSGLFSTIFGAFILMSNLKAVHKEKAKRMVLFFAIAYTLLSMLIVAYLPITTNISILLNVVGAIFLNEYFWNKYLGKELEFERKSWIKPAIISGVISLFVFMALAGSL